MTRQRAFFSWFLPIVLFIVILSASFLWLTTSQQGAQWLFRHAQQRWPRIIQAGEIEGSLSDTLSMSHLQITWQGIHIQSDKIILRWEPRALSKGKLHIKQLTLQNTRVTIAQSPSQTKKTTSTSQITLPRWLQRLRIDVIDLTNVTVNAFGSQLTLNGQYKNAWDVTWALKIPQLSTFKKTYYGTIRAQGKLHGDFLQPTITGDIQARQLQIDNWQWPRIDSTFQAALHPKGAWQFTWQAAKIPVQTTNITLRQTQLHVNQPVKGPLQFNVTTQSQGKLQLEGTWQKQQLNLIANIQNFLASNNSEYRLVVNSDLNIRRDKKSVWFIRGNVNIPTARLSPARLQSTTNLPPEVVFTDQPKAQQATPLLIDSDLTLTLGRDVKIAVWGLQGFLRGELRIQQKPQGIANATGTLRLEKGVYQAYGQKLEIQRGELLYAASPVDNPGLNVQAERRIQRRAIAVPNGLSMEAEQLRSTQEDIRVGIRVQGQLQQPQITLYSIPANLSDANKIAYLVLGHPLQQTSQAQQGQLLLQAIAAMNTQNGTFTSVTQELQQKFSLDELELTTENGIDTTTNGIQENLVLTLGKALSPRLYLSYGIGLMTPLSTLRLQYRLGHRWILQGETSTQGNGLDLFYRWEHD